VQSLIEEALHETRKLAARRKSATIVSIGSGLVMGVGMTIGFWLHFATGQTNLLMELFFPMQLALMLGGMFAAAPRRYRRLLTGLSRVDDIRAAGPLIDALDITRPWLMGAERPDIAVQNAAKVALTRILPRLTRSDAGQVSSGQQSVLSSKLYGGNSDLDFDFLLAILHALEKVGDSEAMTAVAFWTRAYSQDEKVKLLRAAAIMCQKALQVRAVQEKKAGTLLRPAEPEPPGVLLRAAAGVPTSEESTLVRPMIGEAD
jgi:hypothetical protein